MSLPALPPLLLASASPRRAELLQQLEVEFQTWVPNLPEVTNDQFSPLETCQINAYRKARAAGKKFPDALVIAADTLVALDDRLFGKPRDRAEAEQMLGALQGKTHLVVTGVCLLHLRDHRQKVFAVATSVTFHPLSRAQIQRYHALVDPLDKAGAYGIQDQAARLVERIHGSFSNVVGLPLEEVEAQLQLWALPGPSRA